METLMSVLEVKIPDEKNYAPTSVRLRTHTTASALNINFEFDFCNNTWHATLIK